eukprot:COSAG06_NODE_3326_length_5501_cov_63.180118_4_plen_53_part_00
MAERIGEGAVPCGGSGLGGEIFMHPHPCDIQACVSFIVGTCVRLFIGRVVCL